MIFKNGDRVRKKSGSEWQGRVVGQYSTALTPEGYAVESETHRGSVQIYPAKALELVDIAHSALQEAIAKNSTKHQQELADYRVTVANREARIAELESQLEVIGAGGVEPLRKGFVRLTDVLARLEQGFGANSAPVTTIKRHFEMQAAPAHPSEVVPAQAVQPSDALIDAVDAWFADNTGLGGCSDKDVAELAAIFATQPAAQGIDGREFPPLTPELASILGLPCFQCIPFAKALRAAGHTIKTRAEDEQAAVLHWMLGHYFRHGDDWSGAAAQDMSRMKAATLAAQAKQGGE